MSDHSLKRYIVTLKYQEESLGDIQSLNSTMVNGGFSTTLMDDDGHPHELGTNSFGLVSALEESEIIDLATKLAEVALHQKAQVEVTTLDAFLDASS